MIEVIPTEIQIEKAKIKFDFNELKNSITKGNGNILGALGEIIVCDYYKNIYGDHVVIEQNTYDWDLTINGFTIDVKTKNCTSKPINYYNVTVSNSNIKQKCQYYCFVRIMNDFSKAWILGFLPKDKFYKLATFAKRDSIDPTKPEWTFKDDCYNLEISKLAI